MTWMLSALAAFALAGVHLAGAVARPVSAGTRSFAGGIGVGYVFVIVLPTLSTWQSSANEHAASDRLVFVVAMIGLCLYYLLEVGVTRLDSRRGQQAAAWLHLCGFALYSAIVGFVLASYAERGAIWLAAYAAALGLHFYMNDRFLFSQRGQPALGRWMLAGALLLGWLAGLLAPHRYTVAAFLFAVLAGGMMLNILKEELPRQKDGVALRFLMGTGVMTVIGFLLPLQGH